jgi:hypothetical protein
VQILHVRGPNVHVLGEILPQSIQWYPVSPY